MRLKVLGECYHNFITINLEDIKNCYMNYYDLIKDWDIEWLRKAKGVYELHTEEGQHPHFHILSYTKRKKATLIRDISKKFNIKENFVHIKTDKHLYKKHIDYINGIKKDSKDKNVLKDRAWREELGIPQIINF